jgi:hypothetical protein
VDVFRGRPLLPPLPWGLSQLPVCRHASLTPAFVVNVPLRPNWGTGNVFHLQLPFKKSIGLFKLYHAVLDLPDAFSYTD